MDDQIEDRMSTSHGEHCPPCQYEDVSHTVATANGDLISIQFTTQDERTT